MQRVDGTSPRQHELDLLDLVDAQAETDLPEPMFTRRLPEPFRPTLRLLRRDVYAELARRRRKAQITARHQLDRA